MFRNKSVDVFLLVLSLICLLCACSDPSATSKEQNKSAGTPMFTLLGPEETHVGFNNALTEGLNTNVLIYEYFYNGGGVATGDLNGDGLQDIYFTGNMTDNKLYLNKGKMQFEDVTDAAGVAGRPGPWKTGVTMVDLNGDSKLDIYLSYSGKLRGEKRAKQLFINEGNDANGIPRFSEQAQQYGLADSSYTTQSVFFDYDRDGDLDLFILNHSIIKRTILDEATIKQLLPENDGASGVKLLRNDHGHFSEVTKQAGIRSTILSHGLGIAVSDVNGDGWPDLYISNDYLEPDYLYINQKNGTFTDQLQARLGHTSFFSMGNDISDLNNDGLPDIITLDMLPDNNHRQKLLFAPDNYEKIEVNIRSGFYYQYMSNMLQVNNGDCTFSEIAQLSGISNTDWSWAPLAADYDNDGWKDLYVTNGYLRDYTNMDFMKYMGDFLQNRAVMRQDLLNIVQKMPASNVVNYLYKNNGDLTFTDVSGKWGMNVPSNSNGAAYADLDNDGDLDLVVNNINLPAFIYRNEENNKLKNHYLQVNLKGAEMNTQGLGAKVTLYSKGRQQFLEQMPARGFQSSVTPVLHFGLGTDDRVDSLRIVWQSSRQQTLVNLPADKVITLDEKNAVTLFQPPAQPQPAFREISSPITYRHDTRAVNDFKRQPLLLNPMSAVGPCLVKGDVNNDGLEDMFAGGGDGKAGSLFIQRQNGHFVQSPQKCFEADKLSLDSDALFFDADGDGFQDLYVCSGGYNNYLSEDPLLEDRLYLNDKKGNFAKSAGALPLMRVSKSCVRVSDVNGDGFPDLFVGGRVIPGRYPETPQSFLLINDGKGRFTNQVSSLAPALQHIGMVTDAAWTDINADGRNDLVVTGEWMPVTVFININGKLENKTTAYFDKPYSGWWNKLLVTDLNHDGKNDLVIGNLGLNTQCKVTDSQPAEMYYKDFDENGSVDPILCFYIRDTSYPYVTRDELLDQMSMMRTRYADYRSYADARLADIFSEEELKDVNHLRANFLKTAYFESGADGKFHEKNLPLQAQYSPVFAITHLDYDHDGNEDLLLCGNINHARLRFGKYDANYGTLLKGDGKGNFRYVSQQQSGFKISGDVRSVIAVGDKLLFGLNRQAVKAYELRK